jgi:hypothetical protein
LSGLGAKLRARSLLAVSSAEPARLLGMTKAKTARKDGRHGFAPLNIVGVREEDGAVLTELGPDAPDRVSIPRRLAIMLALAEPTEQERDLHYVGFTDAELRDLDALSDAALEEKFRKR